MNEFNSFLELVTYWTKRDYCTQKIKAEVIIDMLISGFIEEIVEYGLKKNNDLQEGAKLTLIAKEFPISREGQNKLEGEVIDIIANSKKKRNKSDEDVLKQAIGDRQYANVDYLLSDDKASSLYLVELKTTKESVEGTQLLNMMRTCENGAESLFYRFYDLIMHKIKKDPNNPKTKKYLYTLQCMNDLWDGEKEDISSFWQTRDSAPEKRQENCAIMKSQFCAAQKIMEKTFNLEAAGENKPEMKIVYISLNKIKREDVLEEAGVDVESDKAKYLLEPIILKELIGTDFLKESARWNDVAGILKSLSNPGEN